MRRMILGIRLSTASLLLAIMCGCSWQSYLPESTSSLPNTEAIERALRSTSLTSGEQPFHLLLVIGGADGAQRAVMNAQIDLYWINPNTYRTVIHAPTFTLDRTVNGPVVAEHSTGEYYPRWIQNFVDALLDPVPNLKVLRKIRGTIPAEAQSHACISTSDRPAESAFTAVTSPSAAPASTDPTTLTRVCFEGAEPKLVSVMSFTRSIWFDDFSQFGTQQIPHRLINNLSAHLQLRGQIMRLEPLAQFDYTVLRARELTLPANQILTSFVPESTARELLETSSAITMPPASSADGITIYVRTDRTGRVREAYRATSDSGADLYDPHGVAEAALGRALTLRFRPLIIQGAAQQMEAPLSFPSRPR